MSQPSNNSQFQDTFEQASNLEERLKSDLTGYNMSFDPQGRTDSFDSSWQSINNQQPQQPGNKEWNLTINTNLANQSMADPLHIDPSAISMDMLSTAYDPMSALTASSDPLSGLTNPMMLSRSVRQHGQYTPPQEAALLKRALPSTPVNALTNIKNEAMSPIGENIASINDHDRQHKGSKLQNRRRKRASKTVPEEQTDEQREQFLARNRVAASKSRQKKKRWTQILEDNLRNQQAENTHLKTTVDWLRQEVLFLKGCCLDHVNCDCDDIREHMKRSLPIHRGESSHEAGLPARSRRSSAYSPHSANQTAFQPSPKQEVMSSSQTPPDGNAASPVSTHTTPSRTSSTAAAPVLQQSLSSSFSNSLLDLSSPMVRNRLMPSQGDWHASNADNLFGENQIDQLDEDQDMVEMWTESISPRSGDYVIGNNDQ